MARFRTVTIHATYPVHALSSNIKGVLPLMLRFPGKKDIVVTMKTKWTDNRGFACFGVWEKIIWSIVILWVISFTLVSSPDFPSEFPEAAHVFQWFDKNLPLLFLAEYVLRILCSSRRIRYIFSPMGLVDLAVCLPALLPLIGVDEKSVLYSLRIVELFSIFKLFRFNKVFEPAFKILRMVKKEFFLFFGIFLFLNYFFAMGIYMAERNAQPEKFASILDGLWFAVVSLTTTGYGDVVPVTDLGKFFTGCIMILGIALIAVPTALLTSATTRLWQTGKLENIEKALKKDTPALTAQVQQDTVPEEAPVKIVLPASQESAGKITSKKK